MEKKDHYMACVYGKSVCETCGKEFEWRRYNNQPPARFCNRKCTNKDFGIRGNKSRIFWPNATELEKLEKLKDSFEKKVIRREGCWDWKGHTDKNGYAQLNSYNGKNFIPIKAHRFSYEIHIGKIDEGKIVCHTCDNPICTNPEHLWIGLPKQNTQDCIRKKRFCVGSACANAKLDEEKVKVIKNLLGLGVTVAKISRNYDVSYMAIQNIKLGKTWKHVG